MMTSINRIDLNLLRVFDAVMEERSVLRAGQRVCLSQSAVSHALGRLREMLDDELFIRTPTGMQPTERALAMAPLIRSAWTSLESAIGFRKFEPSSSTRRFNVALSDFVTMVLGPHLLSLVKVEAPSIGFAIRPDCRMDFAEQVDLGKIDAAIGTFSEAPPRFRLKTLFSYDDVLIARSSYDIGTLSIDKLPSLRLVAVSLHGDHEGGIDGFIYGRGLGRRSEMYDRIALERACSSLPVKPHIAVSLPHFLALPSLLAVTDLAAIVPRPLAQSFTRVHPISSYELPYRTSRAEVSLLWHQRNDTEATQEWLRDIIWRAAEPMRGRFLELDRLSSLPRPVPHARFAAEASADLRRLGRD